LDQESYSSFLLQSRTNIKKNPDQIGDQHHLGYTFGMILTPVACILSGWLIGALLNILADQLPDKNRIGQPQCIHCRKNLFWSRYLTLGRCDHCGQGRTARSWVVQVGFPLLCLVVWFFPSDRIHPVISIILLSYFGIVSIIDIEHRLILGPISLAGLIIGVSVGIYLHDLPITLLGGAAGAGIMWILYQMGRLFSRWMSYRRGEVVDEEALGFGDVYVAAIIGFILGWPGITAGLFLAILAGGVISGLYLLGMVVLRRYQPFKALPYAPFLLLAAVVLIYRP